MNKTRSLLVIIMGAAVVAAGEPQGSSTPPAMRAPPAPPPALAFSPVTNQPAPGLGAEAPGNPAIMGRFMGDDCEEMLLNMLSGDPLSARVFGLSEVQAKAIKESMAASEEATMELDMKWRQAMVRRSNLWKADPLDEAALMQAAGEASEISAQITRVRVKQALTAISVLTPEQRVALRDALKHRVARSPWMQPGSPRSRQPGTLHGPAKPVLQSQSQEDAIKRLIGAWKVTKSKGNYNAVWTFQEDGTVLSDESGGDRGTWEFRKDRIEIVWSNGDVDAFILPIDPTISYDVQDGVRVGAATKTQ